jgi:hypothetical protein
VGALGARDTQGRLRRPGPLALHHQALEVVRGGRHCGHWPRGSPPIAARGYLRLPGSPGSRPLCISGASCFICFCTAWNCLSEQFRSLHTDDHASSRAHGVVTAVVGWIRVFGRSRS